MRRVKSKNTNPELRVRGLLRRMGHRGYRIHRTDIFGKPDIVWVGRKLAIFINGCFWHGHTCRRGARLPQTRTEYWQSKIERNRQRDTYNVKLLVAQGWRVLILWECELNDDTILIERLQNFLC